MYKHLEPLKGIIQLGGTDFIKNFDYSVTPILTPKPECSTSIEKKEVNIYLKNIIEQVSIPGIPGGEYTISISIEGHETKKGIKILVPSNDTISTENIKLTRIKK